MKISGYDSSSISTLFSSLGGSSGGTTDLLGINYSDYATIRSGSYFKLMKSYFNLDSDTSAKSSKSRTADDIYQKTSASTSRDSAKTLANIEDASESLTATAKELYTRSNNKVFAKDSDGNYDADKIYSKVSEFVEEYNSLLSHAGGSDVSQISRSLSSMKSATANHESTLSKIGITVDSKNGKLSIDKETFLNSDMAKVQALFQGTGSYAYGVATQSSMIDSYAQAEAAKSNTYGSGGSYSYNYNSGSIFTDYI
ncbi:MAG: flagellar filament capping protein FliD [Muribaculaceae bacterium]|nr:flagellar filament capping protein FliD [Roseburia sp.]MCM1431122.1 flagellar filament capping protein FliD [Muribaculaceae bacterium]MCM1492545.1 flagellar filament capping protein FliD [Muribaculaceae bacterium]